VKMGFKTFSSFAYTLHPITACEGRG
jgi:hypothetical protein